MKHSATLLFFAAAALAFPAAAANQSYYVNEKIGTGSVSGYIVTDGTIGVLAQTNIVGVNLLLNDGTSTRNLTGVNFFPFSGSDLSATTTQLLFNFSGTDMGVLDLSDASLDFHMCFSTATGTCWSNRGGGKTLLFSLHTGANNQFASVSGTQAIGRVAAVQVQLAVSSSHIGSFLEGQSTGEYTILVQNGGPGPPYGAVSVADTLPAGFTATAINGPGWACTLATVACSRSDGLAAGSTYPPVTVTVSVASNAASPVTNQVSASGGGSATAIAFDPTTITPAFSDVGSSDPFLPAIDLMAEYSITSGCGSSPPVYCPGENITRGQVAVFVVRSVMGGDNFTYTTTPYFTDVPASYPFFKWIQKMYDLGITTGCGAGNYCPDDPVTRDQMAVFIIRARYGATTSFAYQSAPDFTDVPATDGFFPWIQEMDQVGITSGCGANMYCPNEDVTRDEMAIFIMRGAFNQLLPANIPVVAWISTASALPGQAVTVTIVGQNTNFMQGVTNINAGAGVTVSNIAVADAGTLTAQLAVASSAAPGPRSVTVTTGSEEATLPNGFLVQ